MYVSSCKSVDMKIDIIRYKEGFSIVVKVIKKWVSITNVSVKVRSKTIVMITIAIESVICVQLHLSGRRGKLEDFLEFSGLCDCPFQFVSDGCQV